MILAIGDSNLYPACTESEQPVNIDNMIVVFSRSSLNHSVAGPRTAPATIGLKII
jgi:hypothetical protein